MYLGLISLKMGIGTPLKKPATRLVWGWLLLIVLWAIFIGVRNTPDASLQGLKASASDIWEHSGEFIKGSLSAGPWSSTTDVWHPEEEFYQEPDEEVYKEEQHQAASPKVDGAPIKAEHKPQPTFPIKSSQSNTPLGAATSDQPQSWDLAAFQKEWLSVELGGAFDGSHLLQLCNATTWRDDIVLQMLHSRGGIANVRGTILDFFHLAIRVGASHVVLPQYVKRADASLDWTDESSGYWPFGNLFDADWIVGVVDAYCPQMTVYRNLGDAPYDATVEDTYQPRRARQDKAMNEDMSASVADFEEWLEVGPAGYEPGRLNLVSMGASMLNFDMLPFPRMRTTLGRMLRINPVIRELAAAAVYRMRDGHGLDTIDPRQEMYEDAYYGMHLRTEKDATTIGWAAVLGGFDRQTDAHLEHCKSLGLRVIYAATGNEEDVLRFAEKAMKQANITVVSKHSLITEPQHAAALKKLTWDQRGALDWEVLARSTFFSGPVMVSLSFSNDSVFELNRFGAGGTNCPTE